MYMIHRIPISNPHTVYVYVVASGSRFCVPPEIQLRSLYISESDFRLPCSKTTSVKRAGPRSFTA
jgi:hypothetical protein